MLSALVYRPLMNINLKMADVLADVLPIVSHHHFDIACWCYEKIWCEPFEPYEDW